MYIGREDQKNILSCVDFTRLFNIINRFSELNIDILREGISFNLSYGSIAFKQREKFLTGLDKYVKQINKRTYGDYTITENYFSQDCPFIRATEMRITCNSISERQHKHMRQILIPLCKNPTDIYHLNILRIIKIIYHLYIGCEFYNLEYTKK